MKSIRKKFRTIAHIRLPHFITSVEEALRPQLRSLPLAVCGCIRNQYIVVSRNSSAQKCGVKEGMTIEEAYRLTPEIMFVYGSIRLYESFSREFFAILKRLCSRIEPTSASSAFVELEGFEKRWISADEACRHIARVIADELEMDASTGVAGNKVTAEIASKITAPGFVTSVAYGTERSFLAPLLLNHLPGIGTHTADALNCYGLRTIGDITRVSHRQLKNLLGFFGITLWQLANAFDDRPVAAPEAARSMSSSLTFDASTESQAFIQSAVYNRLSRVYHRMRAEEIVGKTAFVRIQCANGSFATHQKTFVRFGDDYHTLRIFVDSALEFLSPLHAPVQSVCVGLKNLQHASATTRNSNRNDRTSARVQYSLRYMQQNLGMSPVLQKSIFLHPTPEATLATDSAHVFKTSTHLIPLAPLLAS